MPVVATRHLPGSCASLWVMWAAAIPAGHVGSSQAPASVHPWPGAGQTSHELLPWFDIVRDLQRLSTSASTNGKCHMCQWLPFEQVTEGWHLLLTSSLPGMWLSLCLHTPSTEPPPVSSGSLWTPCLIIKTFPGCAILRLFLVADIAAESQGLMRVPHPFPPMQPEGCAISAWGGWPLAPWGMSAWRTTEPASCHCRAWGWASYSLKPLHNKEQHQHSCSFRGIIFLL